MDRYVCQPASLASWSGNIRPPCVSHTAQLAATGDESRCTEDAGSSSPECDPPPSPSCLGQLPSTCSFISDTEDREREKTKTHNFRRRFVFFQLERQRSGS